LYIAAREWQETFQSNLKTMTNLTKPFIIFKVSDADFGDMSDGDSTFIIKQKSFPALKPMVIKQLLIILLSDLAEVMSVTPAAPAPGPPKKTDDKSFFDVSKVMHSDCLPS